MAFEDNQGEKIVLVLANVAGFPMSITDVASARAAQLYGLDRRQLLFGAEGGEAPGTALVDDLVTAIGAALNALAPATLSVDMKHQQLRTITSVGNIRGTITVDMGVEPGFRLRGCPASGESSIESFKPFPLRLWSRHRMLDLPFQLHTRGEGPTSLAFPIQWIQLGGGLNLLALGGDPAPEYCQEIQRRFPQTCLWIVTHANALATHIPFEIHEKSDPPFAPDLPELLLRSIVALAKH